MDDLDDLKKPEVAGLGVSAAPWLSDLFIIEIGEEGDADCTETNEADSFLMFESMPILYMNTETMIIKVIINTSSGNASSGWCDVKITHRVP